MVSASDPNVRAWRLFLLTHTLLLENIESELSAAGLPQLSWYDLLWELEQAESRKLRMHELAERIVLSRYNLTRLADRIADAGLIAREDCVDDRRGYFLVLTPAGARMRKKMWNVYGPLIDVLFGRHLTSSTAGVMADSFVRMIQSLREPSRSGSSITRSKKKSR